MTKQFVNTFNTESVLITACYTDIVMTKYAVILGFLFTLGGLWLSYELKLPSGATIILLGGTVLAISFGVSRLRLKKNKIKEAV